MGRYLDRPREHRGTSYAAQYQPGRQIAELLHVARKKDADAVVAELPELQVLVVRYEHVPDDAPAWTEYEVVEAGSFLVYSQDFDLLYDSDAETFAREHEPVVKS